MRINLNPWLERYPGSNARMTSPFSRQRRARESKGAGCRQSDVYDDVDDVPLFAVALALFTAFPRVLEFRGAVENAVLKALPGQISTLCSDISTSSR